MTTPEIISRRINAAAAQLTAAGRADTAPGTRIHCLLAAEYLQAAGARPDDTRAAASIDVERTIRAALWQLAALPPHAFATAEILNAAAAARTALTRVEKR